MAAEKALAPRFPVRVMPTLRQITAACGISLRVEPPHRDALKQALEEHAIPPGDCRLYEVQDLEVTQVI